MEEPKDKSKSIGVIAYLGCGMPSVVTTIATIEELQKIFKEIPEPDYRIDYLPQRERDFYNKKTNKKR